MKLTKCYAALDFLVRPAGCLFFPAPELETWKFGNMLGSWNLGRDIGGPSGHFSQRVTYRTCYLWGSIYWHFLCPQTRWGSTCGMLHGHVHPLLRQAPTKANYFGSRWLSILGRLMVVSYSFILLYCYLFFSLFFLEHKMRLTTWLVFRQVEREFHNQESNFQPLRSVCVLFLYCPVV